MRRISAILLTILVSMILTSSMIMAIEIKGALNTHKVNIGQSIVVTGNIDPGQDLFVVVCEENLFKADDVTDVKEKRSLKDHGFMNTTIPAKYYIVTNLPEALSTVRSFTVKQKQFTYKIIARKIREWRDIDPNIHVLLRPIKDIDQWNMLIYSHEDQIGIDTITREKTIVGGHARMILSDFSSGLPMDKGVLLKLDKTIGKYSISLRFDKSISPNTKMAVYVNGERIDTFTIE